MDLLVLSMYLDEKWRRYSNYGFILFLGDQEGFPCLSLGKKLRNRPGIFLTVKAEIVAD
jgi:hypothetical protein